MWLVWDNWYNDICEAEDKWMWMWMWMLWDEYYNINNEMLLL